MKRTPAFTLLKADGGTAARRGLLRTLHGDVETPVFMPVGTQATVKATFPRTLKEVGAQIILGNTYHLKLRPGSALIRELGGLHRFMGWDRPILTDSGGYQVFSLSKLRKVTDDGVTFRSHLDGEKVFLGPKEAMAVQIDLGSDIAMVLDECPAHDAGAAELESAVGRTLRWAEQSLEHAESQGFRDSGHHVFGIVQGGSHEALRRRCAEALAALEFPGYAIGGVSVGESEAKILEQAEMTAGLLPVEKPRYVMGVGTPPQLLRMIAMGVDLFDCVMPTRAARHGTAYTPEGRLNMKNKRWKRDDRPLVDGSPNYTCARFSRAYLRHLVSANEPLGGMLLTLHNLWFYLDLMRRAREHIESGDFATWHAEWIGRYEGGRGGSE